MDRAQAALREAQTEHASYGGLLAGLGELEEAEAAARAVLHRTEVARSKVEASPPSRLLEAQADEVRERVEQASTRRVSQRFLLAALVAVVLGGAIVLLGRQPSLQAAGVALLLIGCGLAVLGMGRRDATAVAGAAGRAPRGRGGRLGRPRGPHPGRPRGPDRRLAQL